MPKDPSPLLGYNNNIRHKNRVFHVQTEDSGVKHPHIITHLFMDGGRILKSVKTSYAEHVGAEKMADVVRQMMKEQHKAMLIALRDGQFDHILDGAKAPSAGKPGAKSPTPKAAPVAPGEPPSRRPSAAPGSAARIDSPAAHAATMQLKTPAGKKVVQAPTAADEEGPATTRQPGVPREELTLDIDALERAAAEAGAPTFEPQSDLPPPPANLLRERGGGQYRAVTPVPPDNVGPGSRPGSSRPGSRPPSSRPPKRSQPPPMSPRFDPRVERQSSPPGSKPKQEGRYAPARPAAIFGQARPKRGNSIFGEDLISDKSLDEVILSYLAEDLDAPSEKKRNK